MQVAAGAEYGEFLTRDKSHGFSPGKHRSNANHGKTLDKFAVLQIYSFLANPCKINPVLLLLVVVVLVLYYINISIIIRPGFKFIAKEQMKELAPPRHVTYFSRSNI